jgi:Lar family restriction alleviation protein
MPNQWEMEFAAEQEAKRKARLKIQPCPFCGNEELQIGDNWSCGDGYIHCPACDVTMSCSNIMSSKTREQEAINKWNKRV